MFENIYLQIALAAVIFVLVDLVWLAVMKNFYMTRLSLVSETTFRIWPVILLYILMAIGLVVFVLPKGHFGYGLLFGLVGYAIYDLTNYALFSKWTLDIVAVDLVWGAVLNGLVAFILLELMKI